MTFSGVGGCAPALERTQAACNRVTYGGRGLIVSGLAALQQRMKPVRA